MGTATGYFRLVETNRGVKVTNGFYGDNGVNLVGRYFGLFMDQMVGPQFEKGLENLKNIAEEQHRVAVEAAAKEFEAEVITAAVVEEFRK